MSFSSYRNEPFAMGELVSMREWDATVRSINRIGSPASVIDIRVANSETGWMVTVEGPKGDQIALDANWLRPWTPSIQLDWTE